MLKNYFKTAIRNFLRYRNNSVINIAGLTVGFAAFLLIFLVIKYEKSFDDFHPDKNNIYRVVRIGKNINVREYRAGVPFPVTQTLRTEAPQLKNAAAIYCGYNVQVDVQAANGSVLKKFKEPKVFVAETQFFRIFNFPLAEGNIATALSEPGTVFAVQEIASKYFVIENGDWKNA